MTADYMTITHLVIVNSRNFYRHGLEYTFLRSPTSSMDASIAASISQTSDLQKERSVETAKVQASKGRFLLAKLLMALPVVRPCLLIPFSDVSLPILAVQLHVISQLPQPILNAAPACRQHTFPECCRENLASQLTRGATILSPAVRADPAFGVGDFLVDSALDEAFRRLPAIDRASERVDEALAAGGHNWE
jgi:hypothetical protein